MQRFRQMKTLQKFSAVHAAFHNHFNQDRHLISRTDFKARRSAALAEWKALAARSRDQSQLRPDGGQLQRRRLADASQKARDKAKVEAGVRLAQSYAGCRGGCRRRAGIENRPIAPPGASMGKSQFPQPCRQYDEAPPG